MIRHVSMWSAMVLLVAVGLIAPAAAESAAAASDGRYACRTNLIEVIFSADMQVRLRDGRPVDLKTNTPVGVDAAFQKAAGHTWLRMCDLSEEQLDDIQTRGEAKRGQPVFNLNNIYRLRIPEGLDVWETCRKLETVEGVASARPMPLPTPPPSPPDYEPNQGYLDSAGSTPVGIDAHYAWTWSGGDGTGVTVCDIEYSWNYNHGDIAKAYNSQINPRTLVDPFPNDSAHHGTAVIGILAADENGMGVTGICHGAALKTCGSYFIVPGPPIDTTWDVPAAIAYAVNVLSPGDVILLEHQWDYGDPTTSTTDFIPIEWWTNSYPSAQLHNGVYIAIENAIANGINVVEAGGNGGAPTPNTGYNTGALTWYGDNYAAIVGAGGVYSGGTYPEGDLERISWASYGPRYNFQGWGENVVTTGYGDLYSAEGRDYTYTNTFAGTSSASPIVAGAMACCVGYYKDQGMNITYLGPSELRGVLSINSTAQVIPPAGVIGPRPNLKGVYGWLRNDWADVSAPPIDLYGQRNLGVAWGDFNGDSLPDIYATNFTGNSNKLFANNNGNDTFIDVTAAPLNVTDAVYGAAWGDYDNDGDQDLYIANYDGANKLFRNNGNGTFTDVTAPPLNDSGCSLHVCWVDYNNDGKLDIYHTTYGGPNRLYRNNGDGTFTDVSAGSPVGYNGNSGGAAWGNYDNDGDMDLYLTCNYGEANHLYRNDGGGTFVDVTAAPLNDAGEGYGADWGDYDNDGDLDLYLVNNGQANKLFRNNGGTFVDVTTAPLNDAGYGTSAGWADYDNDGNLDLYLVNSAAPNQLFIGDGAGGFTALTLSNVLDNAYGCSFGWGDYDLDGDLDIYLANAGIFDQNRLFRNNLGNLKNWFEVDLVGTVSNRSAVGARVRLVAGGKSQIREVTAGSGFCSQHTLTVEFGLDTATTIDSLIIRWPRSGTQVLTGLSANNHIWVTETAPSYVCGDANGDTKINSGDAVYIVSYIFRGGPAPVPLGAGDANCNGKINSGDAIYIISYIFRGGPALCCP